MASNPPTSGDELNPTGVVQVFTEDGTEHRIITAERSPTGAVTVHVEPTPPQPHQRATLTSRLPGNQLGAAIHRWLERHSITLLRLSMGAVIFGFGVLKYFPGVSPAEDLVLTTTDLLTFGLVPGRPVLILLATLECVIGLSLITGLGLRVTIYLTALWVMGILSPIVLLPERLFSGPDNAPTLEGQYVLKDVIVLAATLVIANRSRRSKKGPA